MPPTNLIVDLLWSLPPKAKNKIGVCSPEAIAALDSLNLPNWLYRLLRFNWFTNSEDVARYLLESVTEILRNNKLAECLAFGMLPIGTAGNGDPIVIRFTKDSGEVGMLSHEEIVWSGNLTDYYFRVTLTIEEFFLRAVDRLYLPVDSFAAREFSRLQASLRGPAAS